MNPKILLIVSVAANLLLVIYAFRPSPGPSNSHPLTENSSPAPIQSLQKKAAVRLAERTVTNTLVKRFNWESVESPDYKEYIANLRAVGCPDETIRDIILADVGKLFDARKKQAQGARKKFQYWKPGNPFMGMANAEVMEKNNALEEEKNAMIRDLGFEPDLKGAVAGMLNPLESMFDFLPEEKSVRVFKLMNDMQVKIAKSMENGGSPDMTDYARAQKEMEQSLRSILSAEEFQDYELRMSMTANSMRSQVSGWDPDEKQFLDVFKLRKHFDEEFNPMLQGNETETERVRRESALKQLNEKVKETLGQESYANYERAQDWNYQQIVQAVKKSDLGTAEANQVYQMKKIVEEQTSKLQSNSELSREARTAALQAIRQETEQSLQKVMGEKGWEHYNRGYNNQWLKNIATQPPPALTPTEAGKPAN